VSGKFRDIEHGASMVIGDVTAMYFGTETLNVATSKNLRKWTIDQPAKVPHWHFSEGWPLHIIGAVSLPEGIAVFYDIAISYDIFTDVNLHNEKIGRERRIKIGAALFSSDNPKNLIWQSEVPVAEIPIGESEQAYFLGVVPLMQPDKIETLRIYIAKKTGEMGFIELPEDILTDHRDRKPITLIKSEENPILSPTINHWENEGVFNPTAVELGGKVHLLYRAVGSDGSSTVGYASSSNGITIDERLQKPVYTPTKPFEKNSGRKPLDATESLFHSGGSWGGCEDPKATVIGDRVYMTYVAHVGTWPMRTALTSISVKDFLKKRWRWTAPMLMSAPNVGSKSVVILPEKVKGNYVIFHRIWPDIVVDMVPELVFGEVRNKNLLLVHDVTNIERTLGLTHHVSNQGVRCKLPNLVLNRRCCFCCISFVILGEFFSPKCFDRWVFSVFNNSISKILVCKHAIHPKKCRVWVFKKCEECVGEQIFHARAPCIHPYFFECTKKSRCHQRPLVLPNVLHNVKCNGVLLVKWCKIDDVFDSLWRNIIEQFFC
jgi:predicted GH43/DUF377 family glycosyl hydrolase